MGCDWAMRIMFEVTYKNNTTHNKFIDFSGGKGVYIPDDAVDYEVDLQMKDWTNKCPVTIIYENGFWNSYQDEPVDIVYASPKWCGVSIRYTKTRVIELIGNTDNVIRIQAIPHAERRY